MTEEDWVGELRGRGALWLHDGDVRHPHALLPSGLHSDGYLDAELVRKDRRLLNHAARDLIPLLESAGLNLAEIDLVATPTEGKAPSSHDLGWHLAGLVLSKTGKACRAASIELEDRASGWRFKPMPSFDYERVLLTEPILTMNSFKGILELTTFYDAKPLLFVAGLLNASDRAVHYQTQYVALVNRHIRTWKAGLCPLCAAGSKAVPAAELASQLPEAA